MQSTPRTAHPTRRPHLQAMPWVREFAPYALATVIVGPERLTEVPPPAVGRAPRRVVLVVAALDRHGMALVEEAVLNGMGARSVVVECAPATQELGPSAARGLRRVLALAAHERVRVVFVGLDPRTRQVLARVDVPGGLTLAATTRAATGWAAAADVKPGAGVVA